MYREVQNVIYKYQDRFQSDGSRFGVGVGTGVAGNLAGGLGSIGNMIGLGNLIQSGTQLVMGSVKNAEAMDRISNGVIDVIESVGLKAMKDSDMMVTRLKSNFKAEVVSELINKMNIQAVNGVIDYSDCGKLVDNSLISTCNYLSKMLLRSSNHQELESLFTGAVGSVIGNIQKNEIVRPITSAAGSEIGDVVGKGLYDFIEKKLKSIDNKVQVEEKDGSGKKASPDQDPEEKEKKVKEKKGLSKAESKKAGKKNTKKESSEKKAKKEELRRKYGGDEGTCSRDSCRAHYEEPIGPKEAFSDDLERVLERVGMMSEAEKSRLADEIRSRYQEKSKLDVVLDSINPIQEANAAVPIVIAGVVVTEEILLALSSVLASGMIYKAIEDTREWIRKSGIGADQEKIVDNKAKRDIAGSYGSPNLDPNDFEPDDDKDHKEWEVKEHDKAMLHDKHGKFYRDPKAVSENGKRLWWTKDNAGHGGSYWKVFEDTDKGLKWYKDVDKFGNYINGKHKGPIGELVKWKDLRGIHVKK